MNQLRDLYERRAASFRSEVMPFMRYVFGGGLALALGFVGAALVGYYASLIRDFPERFPMTFVGMLVLLPILAMGHVRTYIKPADSLFLAAAEHGMQAYVRPAIWKHYAGQSAMLAIAFSILWPLYGLHRQTEGYPAPGTAEWAAMLAMLLLFKAHLHWDYWRSDQLFYSSDRMLRAMLRWGLAAAFLLVFWREGIAIQALAAAVFVTVLVLLARADKGSPLLWEQLIRREKRTRAAWYRFLGWFVDHLPEQPKQVSSRSLLNRSLAFAFRYDPSQAYRYLYGKAFIRTEYFGIWLRLTIIGLLFIAIVEVIWLKAFATLVCYWACALQLGQLERMFRGYSWLHVYPLPESKRHRAVGTVAMTAQLVASATWALSWAVLAGEPVIAAGTFAAALPMSYWVHLVVYQRKWSNRDE